MYIDIIEADFENENHTREIVRLTDLYARDPMGMEEPLPNATCINLIKELKQMPTAFTLLAYKDGEAVGIANCFFGFSTFEARRLINIHDIAVVPEWRGLGIGQKLLQAVQQKASELDCCKITLEVRDDNPAKALYERFGFENDDPKMWFMTKEIY